MFTPTTFSDGVSGGSQIKTLRDAVIAANADVGIATDSIVLGAGTYTLSLQQPVAGRENNRDRRRALAITSTKHEIVIEGQVDAHGNPTTIINASALNDRVFQIVSAGTTVVFKNLIIENGLAQDDGATGAKPGTTTAEGGGLLDDGGTVTLINVTLQDNTAQGGSGVAGAAGVAGANGAAGEPGGAGASGGAGGNGFSAQGGGLFANGGTVILMSDTFASNHAYGGAGGAGGEGVLGGNGGGFGGNADGGNGALGGNGGDWRRGWQRSRGRIVRQCRDPHPDQRSFHRQHSRRRHRRSRRRRRSNWCRRRPAAPSAASAVMAATAATPATPATGRVEASTPSATRSLSRAAPLRPTPPRAASARLAAASASAVPAAPGLGDYSVRGRGGAVGQSGQSSLTTGTRDGGRPLRQRGSASVDSHERRPGHQHRRGRFGRREAPAAAAPKEAESHAGGRQPSSSPTIPSPTTEPPAALALAAESAATAAAVKGAESTPLAPRSPLTTTT